MSRFLLRACAALALAALAAEPSAAQLPSLPGAGGVIGGATGAVGGIVDHTPLGGVVNGATGAANDLTSDALRTLEQARAGGLQTLRRQHPDLIDTDPHGDAIVRSEVLAIEPSTAALAAAQTRGFTQAQRIDASDLGVGLVVLRAPQGMSTRRALGLLRQLDPQGSYDFNHLYAASGAASTALSGAAQAGAPGSGARVGMIDGGVDAGHPAFAGTSIRQRGFASTEALANEHGTEVASLIAGNGAVRGAAPGASLFVADVYGGAPTGGGAAAIVAAFAWLAQTRVPVINVSLCGPPNRALEAAVRAMIGRGVIIVAAVGNDGPNAPPLYPAAYPGVIGVTAVDARNRALPEAERGRQVRFAAPGADIEAAAPGGRVVAVRGTSYAAPIVAGLLVARLSMPDPAGAQRAIADLAQVATDLGAHGPDPVFGAGLVGGDLRNSQRIAQH